MIYFSFIITFTIIQQSLYQLYNLHVYHNPLYLHTIHNISIVFIKKSATQKVTDLKLFMFFYEFSHQFRNCSSLTYLYFSLALSVLTDYLSAFFIPIFLIKYMINFTIPIAIKYIPNLNNIIYALPPFMYVAALTNHVVFEPFIFLTLRINLYMYQKAAIPRNCGFYACF